MQRLSVIGGVLVLLVLVFVVDPAGRPSQTGLFFGRFHPTIVHFPIALLLLAGVIEILGKGKETRRAVPMLLFVAAWGAIVAAVAGLYLGQGAGYDMDTFMWHQRLGIIVAVLASFAFVWRSRSGAASEENPTPEPRRAFGGLMLLLIGLVGYTGHLGGTLTHGEGYLTRYAPDVVRKVAGLPPKSEADVVDIGDPAVATVYDALIQPILDDKCVGCHNTEIRRGDLALHTAEALLEGGEEGDVIQPGRGNDSDLLKRIRLPVDHREHMPPRDKRQVTVAEAELIRWWIDQGASFNETIAEAEPNESVKFIFSAWGFDKMPTGVFALTVASPDTAAIASLRASGMRVATIAESQPFVEAACRQGQPCMTAAQSALLAQLSDQLIWLDLGRSEVTDSDVAAIANFPHLTRLHLEGTAITDAALNALSGSGYLEYLNLHSTAITDTGLSALVSLESLESLYLWQTEVTADAVDEFRTKRPNVRVNVGASN